ncbi:class I SAM-dependent methyltransferase [Kribbella sindirgiensis]|uniref:Methyltransferase domain-containing protein n=1 Tax=Kribbella sindirgiensis TaxID=1124744 RepID=A0A4R0ISZ7_9ACTN|nr:methyltransferase [Kribbella sindirgiensis]TCC36981.1 methyltransferase domain-containing protein [Kribbella sindirgiensis]
MGDHFFSAEPQSADVRRTVEAQIWGRSYVFTTATGVFSRDRLDIGTSVLLRSVEPPSAAGTFLDLGTGYGPIACALATEVPEATVWAVDVNTRALELTVENAKAAGVSDRVRAVLPDDVPEDVLFDEIWSNPAIHIGKPELHKMLLRWLERLAPGGTARFVVGKNLGGDSLQRWMTEQGYPCERTGSAKGFRVLRARRD